MKIEKDSVFPYSIDSYKPINDLSIDTSSDTDTYISLINQDKFTEANTYMDSHDINMDYANLFNMLENRIYSLQEYTKEHVEETINTDYFGNDISKVSTDMIWVSSINFLMEENGIRITECDGTVTVEKVSGNGVMADYKDGNSPYAQKLNHKKKYNVVIKEGITHIGSYAFYGAVYGGGISIPSSVTSIGDSSFLSSNISSVKMSEGLQTIGNSAFCNNSNLTGDIIIPNSVQTIGRYAFAHNPSINGKIVLGSGLQSTGKYAFGYSMDKVTGLEINSNVNFDGWREKMATAYPTQYTLQSTGDVFTYRGGSAPIHIIPITGEDKLDYIYPFGGDGISFYTIPVGRDKVDDVVLKFEPNGVYEFNGHTIGKYKIVLEALNLTNGYMKDLDQFQLTIYNNTGLTPFLNYNTGSPNNFYDLIDTQIDGYYRGVLCDIEIKDGVKNLGANCFYDTLTSFNSGVAKAYDCGDICDVEGFSFDSLCSQTLYIPDSVETIGNNALGHTETVHYFNGAKNVSAVQGNQDSATDTGLYWYIWTQFDASASETFKTYNWYSGLRNDSSMIPHLIGSTKSDNIFKIGKENADDVIAYPTFNKEVYIKNSRGGCNLHTSFTWNIEVASGTSVIPNMQDFDTSSPMSTYSYYASQTGSPIASDIIIDEKLLTIGNRAFADMNYNHNLLPFQDTTFVLSNIKKGTLDDITIETINIPDSVTSIGNYAFRYYFYNFTTDMKDRLGNVNGTIKFTGAKNVATIGTNVFLQGIDATGINEDIYIDTTASSVMKNYNYSSDRRTLNYN